MLTISEAAVSPLIGIKGVTFSVCAIPLAKNQMARENTIALSNRFLLVTQIIK
jgi:hypothetical protein